MFSHILSFLFPVRCIGCARYHTALCEECVQKIPFALESDSADTFAVFEYGHPLVRRAVYKLKYYRQGEAATTLMKSAAAHVSDFLSSALQSTAAESIVFVPIPQYRGKTSVRGFNQSSVLAHELAGEIVGSTVSEFLTKYRKTKPQAHIKYKQARRMNVVNSMRAANSLDRHRIYVLIDDVTTTGATFAEAKRALRHAGAKKILCVALAHGYAKR